MTDLQHIVIPQHIVKSSYTRNVIFMDSKVKFLINIQNHIREEMRYFDFYYESNRIHPSEKRFQYGPRYNIDHP